MLESHCYSLPFQPKFAQLPWPKNAFLNWTSQTHQVCIQSQLSDYTPLQKLCLFEATQWIIKRWPRDCSWFSPKLHQSSSQAGPKSRSKPPIYLHSFEISSLMNLIFSLLQTWILHATAGRKIQFIKAQTYLQTPLQLPEFFPIGQWNRFK